jgi:hypothetical protein
MRFDASDYGGVAGYGGQQPKSIFFHFGQLLKFPKSGRSEFEMREDAHARESLADRSQPEAGSVNARRCCWRESHRPRA